MILTTGDIQLFPAILAEAKGSNWILFDNGCGELDFEVTTTS
jgi:hypothetical protein